MKRNILKIIILAVVLLGSPIYAFSNKVSEGAMTAFTRYEPDFAKALRRLEELDRRIVNLDLESDSAKMADANEEAEEIMDRIQKRYDLMEDLFKSVSGDYPADRDELFEGFSRLDDYYRAIRDFHTEKFVYRSQKQADKPVATVPVTEKPEGVADGQADSQPVGPAKTVDAATTSPAAAKASKEQSKIDVSGVMKFELKNRNEIIRTQTNALPFNLTETALPNNFGQGKLALTYKFDEKRELFAENRFLKRRRNYPIHENYFTLAYMIKESSDRAWTIKNTLQHSWYPDSGIKDYRSNLAEVFYNERWTKRERLVNLGYQTKTNPHNANLDYYQFNLGDQETWFRENGNFFLEFKGNWRRLLNVNDQDYDNANIYGEYNRTYAGNKAELAISDTFDRREYDQESVNAYRTSYFDNYFRLNYDLPVHDKLAYAFEGQHQIRSYASDEPRGYKELNLFTAAKFKFDKDTRAQADYRYIYNDENTRDRAHKNHKLHGMWQKNFSPDFRVKVDDTMHIRTAPDAGGKDMEFKENLFNAKLSWRLKNSMQLVWNNEYLRRIYERLGYRDYRYLLSGFQLAYAHGRKYDWKLEQSWRWFDFRNGAVSTGWEGETQPITVLAYNCSLKDNLKLTLRASWEKTYERPFDVDSNELLWKFTAPKTITEFSGGLEYVF
ncbi:MAG: hypothetical protein PHD82_03830 [Candidatus Riflebacteria bacterium]|nr:hypothetical protein [Candidatus Riflebacteria bacterium]